VHVSLGVCLCMCVSVIVYVSQCFFVSVCVWLSESMVKWLLAMIIFMRTVLILWR